MIFTCVDQQKHIIHIIHTIPKCVSQQQMSLEPMGCRYGYKGFYNRKQKPVVLNSKAVEGIQLQGGTILGTSRGGADIK